MAQLLARRRLSRRLTIFGRCARTVSSRYPLGDLLVPLLLTPAPEEANDDHGHVVTANTSRLRVGGQAVVHHVLTDLLEVLLGGDTAPDKLDDSLGRLAIPDT